MSINPVRSLFHAFACRLAEHLTRDSPDPEIAYLSMVSTIYSAAASVAGGEWVYMPRENVVELEQRRQRIANAVAIGEAPDDVARREGVHRRTVRRIVGRIGS